MGPSQSRGGISPFSWTTEPGQGEREPAQWGPKGGMEVPTGTHVTAAPAGRDPWEGHGFAQAPSEGQRLPEGLYLALQLFGEGRVSP